MLVWKVCLCSGRRPGVARRASNFLSRRRKKVTKERATPSLRPLRCATGQTCVGAVAGCAAELAVLLRSAARTTTASEFTRHARSDAHAHPATAPPQAQPAGVGQPNSHTGLCFARPRGRGAQRLRVRGRAQLSEAMARVDVRSPGFPSGCAEERRFWRIRARVCLSGAKRREFSETPPKPSTTGCPQRSEGAQRVGSPSLW